MARWLSVYLRTKLCGFESRYSYLYYYIKDTVINKVRWVCNNNNGTAVMQKNLSALLGVSSPNLIAETNWHGGWILCKHTWVAMWLPIQAPKFGGNDRSITASLRELEMAGTIFRYCQYFYPKKNKQTKKKRCHKSLSLKK